MKIREKTNFLRFRKKDTYDKEEDTSNVNEIREKIKDLILDKIDLFEHFKESETRLCSTIEELQKHYIEYKAAKGAKELSGREIAGLIEETKQ